MKVRSTHRQDGENGEQTASAAHGPAQRRQALAPSHYQQMASSSARTTQLMERAGMMAGAVPVQRVEEEEPLQAKFDTAQLQEEEEPLQGKFPAQRVEKPNNTGLPQQLKAGVESLSGMSLDHVKVHYNSDKPAQLNAHAYAQGSEIHVAPGQEQHLPHEAWHVVQQAQGRVQATMQMKEGTLVNDDLGLEQEADRMGAQALMKPAPRASGYPVELRKTGIVQGVFDWAENALNNKRKAGVEITESNAGGNGLTGLTPTAAWAALGPAQDALLTHTVILRNQNGGAQQWAVGRSAAMVPAYFTPQGGKNVWMQWGSIQMTEDYGEFEWIIRHPSDVVGITHYRDQLTAVATARAQVRQALAGTGLAGPLVLATSRNAGPGQVFEINSQATDAASSQITFESTDRATTKNALMEGLTHGLNKRNVPDRASLVPADNAVVNTVTTAAGRVVLAGVDMELVMAFLVGDVCHKMAVLIDGPTWGGAIAANFKQWRTLFPKSHPSQIMLQAMDPPHTAPQIAALQGAINGQAAAIINDITELFARKMQTMRVEWRHGQFTAASDPTHDVWNGIAPNAPLPVGGIPALQAALVVFATQNGVVPATEFGNALAAMTDTTGAAVDVVRSTGFATHLPGTMGFAFEDRAEVATDFPGLASTYARIKSVLNRY